MAYERELSVTYGDITVGGTSSSYLLDGVLVSRSGFVTSEVQFTVVVVGENASDFASNIEDFEAAFRTPDQALRVGQGSETLLDLQPSDGSGFDAMPEIIKRGDPTTDTGRSRSYTVRIQIGRPGERAGVEGLRQNTVSVSYDPSRRRHVTIAGEFTAFQTTAARAQYEAKIDALCEAALTALSGSFELAEETALSTTNDKTMTFSRVYDEVIFTQGGEGLSSTSIVRQLMSVSKQEQRIQPQSPGAQPWIVSNVTYSCWIDKDVTTDLRAKWASIYSFVVGQATSVLGGTAIVFSTEPVYDYDNNRITATLQIATPASSSFVSYTLSTLDEYQTGAIRVPAWVEDRPLSRYRYQGPASYTRTITESVLAPTEKSLEQAAVLHQSVCARELGANLIPTGGVVKDSATWVLISRRVGPIPRLLGIGNYTQNATEWQAVSVYEKIEEIAASTPGGGGVTVGGPTTPGSG